MLLSSRRLVPVLVAGVSLIAAGCASSSTQNRTYAQVGMASYDRLGKKPEIEDDGLPAQIAPARRQRTEPDDPREPFSPNYGSRVSAVSAPAVAEWSRTVTARFDEDAVIQRAILAHEQRYR
jgi:hypothetical protein